MIINVAITLLVITFGIRWYIFNILDRMINSDPTITIVQAKLPLYYLVLLMFTIGFNFIGGFYFMISTLGNLFDMKQQIDYLPILEFSLIMFFGMLQMTLILRPLKIRISKLQK